VGASVPDYRAHVCRIQSQAERYYRGLGCQAEPLRDVQDKIDATMHLSARDVPMRAMLPISPSEAGCSTQDPTGAQSVDPFSFLD